LKLQIVIDGKTYEVEYDTAEESTSASGPTIERAQSIVLPTAQGPALPGTTDIDESKLCRSPVAGIVARVNVQPGQSVRSGDVLVVVDAMKIENNLAAASAARVRFVKAKVGDSVKLRQILIEFE